MKKTISILSLFVLAGCQYETNDYDIKNVGESTYLINQKTGDLSIVDKGKVISLKTYKLPKNNKLSLSGSFKGKLQFEVKTKFIVDRIYYKLTLKGFSSSEINEQGQYIEKTEDFGWFTKEIKNNKYDRITIQLSDVDGFTLKENVINLADDYVQFSDENGEVTGFQYEGDFSVNPLLLAGATSLNYTYRISSLKKAPE
jgi:hypothetical protein